MKKFLFLGICFFSLLNLNAQNYLMASPEGFGAGTTGGGGATPVTVSNYNDFKTNITASPAAVILVSGTITIPAGGRISEVLKNKTIIGLPGAKLINDNQTQSGSGILNLKNGSENVIIRNLIFEGPGAYDTDGKDNLTSEGCTKLWVDHCEFRDGVDGNFDNKGNTDNVTISWCKFTYLKPPKAGGPGGSDDHRYTNLVGSNSSDAPADGHFSITFQNCYWADGCRERMPRARNAELHILNCYYNTNAPNSVALGLGGGVNNLSCYVENTDFDKISTVYKNYASDGGAVSLTFSDCINGASDVGVVSKPSYDYTVIPADEVAAYIPNTVCGAGATLQVSASGEISTICDSTTMYTLSTSSSGEGEGTIDLIPAGGEYQVGTIVSLKATANTGSEFSIWSDGVTGTSNPSFLTIGSDTAVNAEFALIPATGIHTTTTLDVKCYPTLVDNTLNIDFSDAGVGNAIISIYSINGHKVLSFSKSISAAEIVELDLSDLSKGMYFCNIQISNISTSQKIVKR